MPETGDSDATLNLVLAEFNALRDEIRDRAAAAFTVLNINVTATTALLGLVLSEKAEALLLLILPLLSPALGMLFVDHSYNIRNLGAYIDARLRQMAVQLAGDSRVLGYEAFVRRYEQNKLLRFLPLGLPLGLLFLGFPVAVLVMAAGRLEQPWTWTLWTGGVVMTVAFAGLWLHFLIAPYRLRSRGGTPADSTKAAG